MSRSIDKATSYLITAMLFIGICAFGIKIASEQEFLGQSWLTEHVMTIGIALMGILISVGMPFQDQLRCNIPGFPAFVSRQKHPVRFWGIVVSTWGAVAFFIALWGPSWFVPFG